jgi:hypothetical protein
VSVPEQWDSLVRIASERREAPILIRFETIDPDLSDRTAFQTAVTARLNEEPTLIDAWQTFSWDNRGSPPPYLDGLEVGFYDDGRQDVYVHGDRASACADFLFRKASSVLHRRRVGPPT